MAKEKAPDTWGNVKGSKFTQKRLESERRRRMKELNEENGRLIQEKKDLQNSLLDLEDALALVISQKKALSDELTVTQGKLIELQRSKDTQQKLIEYKPEEPKKTTKKKK